MFSLNKSVSKLKALKESKSEVTSDVTSVEKKRSNAKNRKSATKNHNGTNRVAKGVIRISNIPHGFYEQQMLDYFSQFGKVLRVRVAKSKKTGNRRNYGFIEFDNQEVAKIASETMDNYLMFDQILKCQLIPQSKLEEMHNIFKNWNKSFVGTTKVHKSLHNKSKSIDRELKLMRKRLRNVRQMENHLQEKGLDFKCHIINLPDIKKLRAEVKLEVGPTLDETDGHKRQSLEPKPQSFESIDISKSTQKTPKSERIKRFISPRYPKLLKFSILLSANKKNILYCKKK